MENMLQLDLFDFDNEVMEIAPEPQPVRTEPRTELPLHASVRILGPEESGRGNYRIGPDDELFPHGQKSKIHSNFEAVRTLKALEETGEAPCDADCSALLKYSGWGGIATVFDESSDAYIKEFLELKNLLTDSEYRSARASTLTSHYTPRELIEFMWAVTIQCGFPGGKVGEFGAGIGHFIGLMPEELVDKTDILTVEVDPVSARILKMLYPQTTLHIGSLEKVNILNSSLDLVIGNVPYAKAGVYDRKYPNYNLHNYFIARALDALCPGGLAVLLTSASTLDSISLAARENFCSRAALLAAFRLPNTAFRQSAGTEIVADILVFQKNAVPCEPFLELRDVPTGDDTGTMQINEYFTRHPDYILGRLSNTGKMYGKLNTPTVQPFHDQDLGELLKNHLFEIEAQDVNASIGSDSAELCTDQVPARRSCKEFAIFEQDGELYEYHKGMGIPLEKVRDGKPLSENEKAKIRSFLEVKTILNELCRLQIDPEATDEQIDYQRHQLNLAYDAHVRRFGVFSKRATYRSIANDPDYLKVSGCEYPEEYTETLMFGTKVRKRIYKKGDIFQRRTQWPWREPDSAADIVEAAKISYAYRHELNFNCIARLTGLESAEEAREELLASREYFFNPETGNVESRSQYLSGNVVKKLKAATNAARNDPALQANVEALTEVQPKYLHIEDIDFRLGTIWIPPLIIQRWLKEFLQCDADITYDTLLDTWQVEIDPGSRYAITSYKVEKWDAIDILEATLNLREVTITETIRENGQIKVIVNKEATLAAHHIQQEFRNQFYSFVVQDTEASLLMEQVYNDKFNSHIVRQYDLPHFDVYPGASQYVNGKKFILRKDQKRAVSRCIEENCLLAHCVGAGKTAIIVTAAMELKRLKLATKTLVVVQNATLIQYEEFVPQLYPDSKVLIADKRDLVKEKRKLFMTRIATGDWDIIVMAQSSFDMIRDDPEVVIAYYQEKIEELEEAIAQNDSGSVKDAERQKRHLELRLEQLQDRKTVEDVVYFSELGIDAIFVDEAHAYKKDFFTSKLPQVKGLDRSFSKRALALSLKLDHIRKKTGGRNIYFATATPVTNSLAELWVMVRYISPETLEEFNVKTFDQFASIFTAEETALEIDAASRLRMITRFCMYMNIPELSVFFRNVADVVRQEDLKNVVLPNIKGGAPTQVAIPRGEMISKFMEYLTALYEWFENLGREDKSKWLHIPLLIYGLSRKVTLDPRLIDHHFPDNPDSKLNVCVRNVLERYRQYDEIRATQAVFADLYQLSDGQNVLFNAWVELKGKLIANGIPAEEIAIITDYKTEKQRSELYKKANAGEIRVIIGSTQKLGTGVNIQERLVAIHHLDAPFRSTDMEQRNGRGLRQGNLCAEIEILYYGITQTLDAGMFQILDKKQRFISDALVGAGGRHLREINTDAALDYATFSAIISGNEKLRRKVIVENRLRELETLENQYRKNLRNNLGQKNTLTHQLPQLAEDIEKLKLLIARQPALDNGLSLILNNRRFSGNRKEQLAQLQDIFRDYRMKQAAVQAKILKRNVSIPMGMLEINGLKVQLSAYCPFSNFESITDSDIQIGYHLPDYQFKVAMLSISSACTTTQGFLTGLRSLLENKPKELCMLEKELEAKRLKLENLSGETQKLFPYTEEQSSLRGELEQLLIELNKNGEFTRKEKRYNMPLLSEFFPGILLREPVREVREILFTPAAPEETQSEQEECA